MKNLFKKTVILCSATLLAVSLTARAASPATDDACDSAYNWGNFNGQNGGSGFGAWQLIPAGNGNNSGSFQATSQQNGGGGGIGINCSGGRSWGLYANNGAQSTALRPFSGGGLIVGQSVTLDFDNGWINGPYDQNNVHEFQILNGSGVMRFGFHYRGGAGDYQIYDASDTWFQRGTGISFTDQGLHLVITLTGPDSYTVAITRNDGGSVSTFSGTLGGTPGSSLQSLFFVNRNAGDGANFDFFFNNLGISCNGNPSAPSAGSDSPKCEGQNLQLGASGVAGGTYHWSGPNGFSSTDQAPLITGVTVANAGTYTVNVTANGCTSADASVSVVINASPAQPQPSNDGPVCPGAPLNLFANTTASTYTWTGPDGFTSSEQNPTILSASSAAAGTYNLVVSSDGCVSPMGSTEASLKTTPDCSITGPDELCDGTSGTYWAPAGEDLEYQWSVSGNASIDGASQGGSVSITAGSGGFTVSLTVTRDGCSSTCSKSVVNDETAPVVTCPADVTIECDASTDPSNTGSATATDNCSGDIAISHADVVSGDGCNATITRTWTAEDAAGNSATCVQTISLQDSTAPVLAGVPASVNLQCAADIPGEPGAARSWGLYANNGAISEAIRPLNAALAVGQTFVIDMDNGFIDPGAAVGFGLQNAAGENRFELVFVGGDAFYRVKGNGADITTAVGYSGEGLHVEVTLTGTDTYSVKILRIQSGDSQVITGALGGSAGSAIERLRFFNFRAGGGPAFDAFFNSIAIAGVASDSASDAAYNDGWTSGDNGGSGFGAWSLFGSGGSDPDNFGRFVGSATLNDGGDANNDGDINSLSVTAADNCDAHVPVAYSETDNGATGCAGQPRIITRTWSATDDCGKTTVQTQTITQEDTEAPALAGVPADVTVECAGDVPAAATVTASDNCDASATVQFSESSDGNQITRTWTSTDACGNTASDSQVITIDDTILPVLSGQGADATIEAPAAPSFTAPTASDNCDADPAISFTDATTPGACAGAYSVTRTWVAEDEDGNLSAPVSQTITVVDTTAPVLSGQGADATIECPEAPSFTAPSASDDNDSAPSISHTDATTPGSCAGTYSITRTWTAVDACGNAAAPVSQTIQVVDTTVPTMTGVPADISVECDSVPLAATVHATDACDGSVWVGFQETVTAGDCLTGYTMTRIWTVTDCSGNTASATQTITVSDTTAPTVTASFMSTNVLVNPSFEIGTAHASQSIPGWTNFGNAYHEAFVARTGTNHIKAFGNFGTNENFSGWQQDHVASPGQHWRASVYVMQPSSDPWTAGNEAKLRIEFYDAANNQIGLDTAHLKSTIPQDEYLLLSVSMVAPANAVRVRIVPTYMQLDPVNGFGSAYFDDANLELIRDSIHVESAAEVAGCHTGTAIAQDACDLHPVVELIGEASNGGAGCPASPLIITRTFRGTDACGNSSEASITVEVSDTIAPVLSGVPANASVPCGSVPAAAAVTALDNVNGSVAVSFSETQSGSGCSYTITRTWTAQDACGNTTTASQTISVSDTTAPVIACAANQTVAAGPGGVVTYSGATATDNCDASVTVTHAPASGSLLGPGVHTVNVTATDDCGNTSTCSFTVTVASSGLRVVFESPVEDDNVSDNVETDQDIKNVFKSGSKVPHKVKIYNSAGQDVTVSIASQVKVKLSVTERQYVNATTSVLVNDVPENFTGVGSAGGVMVLTGGQFHYNLDTSGYPAGTVNSPLFFRSHVTVEYNTAPGTVIGEEDALLESK